MVEKYTHSYDDFIDYLNKSIIKRYPNSKPKKITNWKEVLE